MQLRKSLPSLFGLLLLARLLYPFFNSPLDHLFSDPLRHWDNGALFLHPEIMGSSDPYLYQLWMFIVRAVSHDSAPAISLASGVLCAALPYGWYRALRELQNRERALVAAIVIGLIPESISLYGYFMNETLLMTLLGVAFWMTLRSYRKRTLGAYALAAVLWSCAAFTRTIAVPMAAACLLWLWCLQTGKIAKACVGILVVLVIAIPAGLHARAKLGFFAPLGNLYFNEIYSVSGAREIEVDYGPEGTYHFGCPSFYNPTFFPWSNWTTRRTGKVSLSIDLRRGRATWIDSKARVLHQRTFPVWRQRWENALYMMFGQSWPNSDRTTAMGWLAVWTRWIWSPLALFVALALARGRLRGVLALVPLCALGTAGLLLMQNESVMEGRYREPIDALLVCSAFLIAWRRHAA